jgi:hypothetical protein
MLWGQKRASYFDLLLSPGKADLWQDTVVDPNLWGKNTARPSSYSSSDDEDGSDNDDGNDDDDDDDDDDEFLNIWNAAEHGRWYEISNIRFTGRHEFEVCTKSEIVHFIQG